MGPGGSQVVGIMQLVELAQPLRLKASPMTLGDGLGFGLAFCPVPKTNLTASRKLPPKRKSCLAVPEVHGAIQTMPDQLVRIDVGHNLHNLIHGLEDQGLAIRSAEREAKNLLAYAVELKNEHRVSPGTEVTMAPIGRSLVGTRTEFELSQLRLDVPQAGSISGKH